MNKINQAICEANLMQDRDKYFKSKNPLIRTVHTETLFDDAFRMGYESREKSEFVLSE